MNPARQVIACALVVSQSEPGNFALYVVKEVVQWVSIDFLRILPTFLITISLPVILLLMYIPSFELYITVLFCIKTYLAGGAASALHCNLDILFLMMYPLFDDNVVFIGSYPKT
jgi:hypothetical protein